MAMPLSATSLRVLLIGDFRGQSCEGLRNVSQVMASRLSRIHEVSLIQPRNAIGPGALLRIRRFRPQVVHYLTGPTLRSLLILALLKRICPKAVTVASAVRPFFTTPGRRLLPRFRPDLFLTQAERWERLFVRTGGAVRFVPNGVDCERFVPVSSARRDALRRSYGLPVGATLVLHVGHIRRNRGLRVLIELQRRGIQTVVVGSPALEHDASLEKDLRAAGCIVIRRFIEAIQEVYACVDCYLFPVEDLPQDQYPRAYNEIGVIDTPLSVLEAMSCNIPVVTTRFGAIPRLFRGVPGLHFYNNGSADDAEEKIKKALREAVETRRAVGQHDWQHVIASVDAAYRDLVA